MNRKYKVTLPEIVGLSDEIEIVKLVLLDSLRVAQFLVVIDFLTKSVAKFKCIPNNVMDHNETLSYYTITTEENINAPEIEAVLDVIRFVGFNVMEADPIGWKTSLEDYKRGVKHP